jgi:hypothetical protein
MPTTTGVVLMRHDSEVAACVQRHRLVGCALQGLGTDAECNQGQHDDDNLTPTGHGIPASITSVGSVTTTEFGV